MSQYNIFQYRLSRISPFYNRSNFLSYMAIGVVCTIISSWISACLSPTLIAKSRDMRVFEKGMDVGDELKIYFHSLVSIRRATFILTKDGMTGTKEGQERVGLPFKAMTWNWTGAPLLPVRRGKFMYSFEPTIDQVNMGIRLGNQGISDALQVRVLPLGIVPWAFALNVFLYTPLRRVYCCTYAQRPFGVVADNAVFVRAVAIIWATATVAADVLNVEKRTTPKPEGVVQNLCPLDSPSS